MKNLQRQCPSWSLKAGSCSRTRKSLETVRQENSLTQENVRLWSIQASNRLDEAHPHRGGQYALLCLLIQMLPSPQNTHRHTENNV